MNDPNQSAWARRGFLYTTRIRMYWRTIRANEPLTIPEAICQQNPNVTMEQATEAVERWKWAAFDAAEGSARYGRGEVVDED